MRHPPRNIPNGIVPGHVHIVRLAVQHDLGPTVVEIFGGNACVIGGEAQLVQHPVIGQRIAVADAAMQRQRAVGRIIIVFKRARVILCVIICDPRGQTVVQQQTLVNIRQAVVAFDSIHQLRHRIHTGVIFCTVFHRVACLVIAIIHILCACVVGAVIIKNRRKSQKPR